jgi:hypothetical protein
LSIQELFNYLGLFSKYISIYFIVLPLLAWIISSRHKKYSSKTSSIVLSIIIYYSSIPGIFSLILISYTIFFTHQNLLEVNATLYFLPLISMLATLFIISHYLKINGLKLNSLPGFKRLSGLLILIAIVFIIVLALYKMRILVGFFGSLQSLAIIAIALFFIIKWAIKRIS